MSASLTLTIDHPLDPENAYLTHTVVAAAELLTIASGTVLLAQDGTAAVTLPAWFERLNRDLRYQLTPIGAAAPNLHIAHEMFDHQFTIAGGCAGLKVAWQVTGVRHDPYAQAHPLAVEAAKPVCEQGSYLHPEEYGQPASKSREHARLRWLWDGAAAPCAESLPAELRAQPSSNGSDFSNRDNH